MRKTQTNYFHIKFVFLSVIRTQLVNLCSRISEYSAQSIGVIGSYVDLIEMFCMFRKEFNKQSRSTARNTEPRSKWQVQWKLCIWEACEQRCARHHAVCWWPRGQDVYMQCELTVACYIISHFLYSADTFDKTAFEVKNKTEDIAHWNYQLLSLFGFYATLWDL